MAKKTRKKQVRSKARTLRVLKQTGSSVKKYDKLKTAKKPGKRRSKTGAIYWETRSNRSDKNRKKRL